MMGTGEASGEDRALMAAQNAIANPLLDEVSLKGAKAVLVNVTGGPDMTLLEVDEACNAISSEVDPDANTIFGAAFDDSLEGKIRVSVVATGMDGASMSAIEARPVRLTAPARAVEAAPPIEEAPAAFQAEPMLEPVLQAPELLPDPVLTVVDPGVEAFRAETEEPEFDLTTEPAPIAARAAIQEDALVIPQRRQEQHAQKAGWRLSLFGARRPEPSAEETPIPQFRNANAVTSAKSMSSAQAVEDHEPEDDLEIPSFLRRLAN